jgi:hypothetical protein
VSWVAPVSGLRQDINYVAFARYLTPGVIKAIVSLWNFQLDFHDGQAYYCTGKVNARLTEQKQVK